MAAAAPPLVITMPVAPATPDRPVFMDANVPVVTATSSFISWSPAPAVGAGPPRVSLPSGQFFAAFGVRCKISSTPADLAASRNANLLNLCVTGTAWSRILGEYVSAGVFASAISDKKVLHERIRSATLTTPANLNLVATDYALGAAWALGAAGVAASNRLIRFLSLATIDLLEISAGPLAATAPFAVICQLVGAIGPVSTQGSRSGEMTLVQAVAHLVRSSAGAGATDGTLARGLQAFVLSATLPKPFLSPGVNPDALFEELQDGVSYSLAANRRVPVEQKRLHFLASTCVAQPPFPAFPFGWSQSL